MKIEFLTQDYEFSTGRTPRGRGSWAFSIERDPNAMSPEIFWSRGSTYAEAKKAARAHFKAKHSATEHHIAVYVLT